MPIKRIEYMCSVCGTRTIRSENEGRPSPGICPKKPKDKNGKGKPHSWIKSGRKVS